MDKDNKKDTTRGGVTDKKEPNAGSGAFNRGSEDDPHLNEGVADGTPDPDKVSKETQNPKSAKRDENNDDG